MGRHKNDCKCTICKEKRKQKTENTNLKKNKKNLSKKTIHEEFINKGFDIEKIVPDPVPEVIVPDPVPEVIVPDPVPEEIVPEEINLDKIVEGYQEENIPEEIVPDPVPEEIVPEENVPEIQREMPIVLKGYFILLIIDIVAPYLLLKLFKMFSKKFEDISPDDIRLEETEKEDLMPIADEVAKGFIRKMSPEFALLISLSAIYSTKIISLKK